MDRMVRTAGRLFAGLEESPRSASFANGCGIDGRFLDRPRRVSEHACSVVVDTFGAFHFVRSAIAAKLPGGKLAPITVGFLYQLSVMWKQGM